MPDKSVGTLPQASSLDNYRLSCSVLFRRNLLDPSIWLLTIVCFLFSRICTGSLISFFLLFMILNYHVESYKNFLLINQSVELLSLNSAIRDRLICQLIDTKSLSLKTKSTKRRDSFNWLNKTIQYLWPYVSIIAHQELNQFLKSLRKNKGGQYRLFHAILHQLNSRVSFIEHFQLGKQHPVIRDIQISESTSKLMIGDHKVASKSALVRAPNGKVLICDLDLHYSGDLNISVIYKYLCCCRTRIGLEDVFFDFKTRFVLGPITKQPPFVEELAVTLLRLPDFGYKGIALVELAELRFVRKLINRLISDHLLQPRVLVFRVAKRKGPTEDIIPLARSEPYDEIPLSTKLMARVLICSVLCSNLCLLPCNGCRKRRN